MASCVSCCYQIQNTRTNANCQSLDRVPKMRQIARSMITTTNAARLLEGCVRGARTPHGLPHCPAAATRLCGQGASCVVTLVHLCCRSRIECWCFGKFWSGLEFWNVFHVSAHNRCGLSNRNHLTSQIVSEKKLVVVHCTEQNEQILVIQFEKRNREPTKFWLWHIALPPGLGIAVNGRYALKVAVQKKWRQTLQARLLT